LVIGSIVLAVFSGNSVFFYSIAACLATLMALKPKVGSAAGNIALCTVGLVLSLSLGIDYTRLELAAAKDISATVTTTSGAFPARVMMMGERGVLLFRADKQTFEFHRPDEIRSIDWLRMREIKKL